MLCLNCYSKGDFVIIKPHIAISLSDGKIYNAKCVTCGYVTQVTENQLASSRRNEIEQKLYEERLGTKERLEEARKKNVDCLGRPIKAKGRNFAFFETKEVK